MKKWTELPSMIGIYAFQGEIVRLPDPHRQQDTYLPHLPAGMHMLYVDITNQGKKSVTYLEKDMQAFSYTDNDSFSGEWIGPIEPWSIFAINDLLAEINDLIENYENEVGFSKALDTQMSNIWQLLEKIWPKDEGSDG